MRPELRVMRALMALAASALPACVLPAWAGEATLVLHGSAPYHGLTLPLSVLAQTRYADLSDVRVVNARGEPVPHAWVDDAMPEGVHEQEHVVPFFRAPAAASATTASQQGGWIIDLRKVKGTLLELRLAVPAGTHGVYGFAIENSDDLQRWHTQTRSAQLLSLQHEGERLQHTVFALSGLHTRYLRLRPHPGSPLPPLSEVRVHSVNRYRPAPPLQWSEPLLPVQCTTQHCDYALPRHLPLERLEWQLASVNALAPVDLLVQYHRSTTTSASTSAAPQQSRRHRLRDHLRGVRHKDAPSTSAGATPPWAPVARTTAYWLRLPEGELRSPSLRLDAGLVTQLRVQPVGGMVQLGTQPPVIRIGAPAVRLVFLAREPAPYRLLWGGDAAPALSLSQLMPTRRPDDALPVDTASVVLTAVAPSAASSATPVAASAVSPAPATANKLWLWGVLLAALVVMAGMAWLLLRPAKPG